MENTTNTRTYAVVTDARMNRGGCYRVTAANQRLACEAAREATRANATSTADRVTVNLCTRDDDGTYYAEGVQVTELAA